ncbi:MAG: RebB family R body protein [Stenotrophomonas maltophilia]|uniref:RebB family R body protein n=1 Tax=Stenotrophomonas TaxID=40323 RepID=UPI0013DC54EE|nr:MULTISPECIES: RebB family R body protein [Stenotrophomonas]MBS4799570.1 RebB family R body protein [Stenotrophomonas maltophilia]MDG9987198.1 RebB family R body protein [Stenotrophomonas sp. GD04024]
MPASPATGYLLDAASAGSGLAIALAPSFAMSATCLAMADSLGLAMQNAVANQQRGQVTAGASLAQVLALIIQKGAVPS